MSFFSGYMDWDWVGWGGNCIWRSIITCMDWASVCGRGWIWELISVLGYIDLFRGISLFGFPLQDLWEYLGWEFLFSVENHQSDFALCGFVVLFCGHY